MINAVCLGKGGRRARYKEGDKLEISEQYHRESWETIKKVVHDLSTAALAKARHGKP